MAEELFSKNLFVLFKCPDREDRHVKVQITIELQTITSPLLRKELVVRLTDERDLFFLYTLRIGEEDFQSLKIQQGLLVDFGAFPQKFIDLLELCLQEQQRDVPKFVLHLVSSGGITTEQVVSYLNVVETNPFKHLTHLSLKFISGADTEVKKYLADCLKNKTEQCILLEKKLEETNADLTRRLRQAQEALSSRTVELDTLRAEWSAKTAELTATHAHEVATEKERVLQDQSNLQLKSERERRELEQAHMKIVKQMESRLYQAENSNKDLTDTRYKSESTIRELKSKLSSLEEEYQHCKQELQNGRKQNARLDSDCHEQEKVINQLRTRLAVVEQENKSKEQVLARSSDLLHSEQDQKKKHESDLERKQRQIAKMEGSIKAMSEELVKGNEIIKKLQGEVKSYHAKLKLRSQVATEQEKLLTDKAQEMDRLRAEQEKTAKELQARQEENKKLNEQLEVTLQKLEESKQLLKTNENVISWLNKQVTEQQLSQPVRAGTFELPSHGPSASYRPSTNPSELHNYSAPSFGSTSHTSIGSHHSRGPPPMVPRAQVQYGAGQPRRSMVPTAGSKASPIPPIPEEISPHPSPIPTIPSRINKENNPPLDSKYFQRSDNITTLGGAASKPMPNMVNLQQPIRISQQVLAPRPAPSTSQPPLASVYFPGQTKNS